ncbi:MAG: hypothetical protein JWN99_1449, partial [Ilumatobacteraceae bacterium]|nr:hypothetical protein [Ilumatobacteraceae bacterium]
MFLEDGDRLVVVAGDQERLQDVDRALAFGLAWKGDRDLVLLLPQGKAAPTLQRLAFLRPGPSVFTHDGERITEAIIPSRPQILGEYEDELELSEKDLGVRTAWITSLVEWADTHQHLSTSHRPSYRAWHCNGRMILRVRATRGGLLVTSGVHALMPSDKYTSLVSVPLTGGLDGDALATLIANAELAIAERLAGNDADHLEHRLQSALGRRPDLLGLLPNDVDHPRRFFRELPCRRPGAARNYIDLAGLDSNGVFHVVETKIGNDEMLVLQGLDYYVWALAHREALAAHLAVPKLRISLDFVVAAKSPSDKAIGPYTARQLDALDGSIPWKVKTVTGWRLDEQGPLVVTSHGSRKMPPPVWASEPVTDPGHVERVHLSLVTASAPLRSDGVSVQDIGTLIHPAARAVWKALEDRSMLHRWASHVRSSQAFAINMFGPLGTAG